MAFRFDLKILHTAPRATLCEIGGRRYSLGDFSIFMTERINSMTLKIPHKRTVQSEKYPGTMSYDIGCLRQSTGSGHENYRDNFALSALKR